MVLQGLREQLDSPYSDVSAQSQHERELPPISAFSRYAFVYSLARDGLRFGSKCASIDTHRLSRQTQGNWVCNPRMFF
jgi:hypothetical protein